ncbi:MAG: hypothetical protein IJC59_01015 [Lachnospiraceae bacterium]|nr:hypothetical protein [Lachnospiraceae bacterium]
MKATGNTGKKGLALLLAAILAMGTLTACGGSQESGTETEAPAAESTQEEAVEAAAQEAPEESAEVTEEVSEEEETPVQEETTGEEPQESAGVTIADYVTGTWEGTVYTNETLGIKMTFPETYTVFTGDTLDELMGQAVGIVEENSDIKNVDESTLKYDFMAIAPDGVGNVILTIEENSMGLTAEDYVEALKTTWEYTGIPYEIIQEAGTETIGDKEYTMIGVALDYSEMTGMEGNTAVQAYMIHTDEDLMYYFITTFSEETIEELGAVMDGIEAL